MKVKCRRAALSEAFSIATTIVPVRSQIPNLMNVRLSASTATAPALEVAGTDLEVALRLTVPAVEVREQGVMVLPAARMAGILRESSDEDVSIESDGHVGRVSLDGSAFKLVGTDPADFPTIQDFDQRSAVPVLAEALGRMVRETRFAVSNEQVRFALTGQLLEVKGGEVRLVASDGKRLAYSKARSGGNGKARDIRAIVPTKAMDLLEKVLMEDDKEVSLDLQENHVAMRTGRATITSRLIEGHFPDYEAVVPAQTPRRLQVPQASLLSAVRKVSLMTTDRTRAIKLTFSPGKLVLFTRAQDVGEARVEIEIDYKGDEFSLVLNPDYVAEWLRAVTEASVELGFGSAPESSAGVLRAGKDYVYVVMPLTGVPL